ncbi:MAG: phosphoribosylglycinamide formyltransferase, partial [Nitrospira sp.]|nr:phosphoribosylglycinamide formyltransferase [Nitrospira sp.]
KVAEELKKRDVALIILAGFMRIVGKPLIDAFPCRIMNIHPALLPSFPGLHGQKQAVDYGVKISGCTVHFVDEGMDTGPIIIQAAVHVAPDDTEESLSERILRLEHRIYPEAIRLFAEGRIGIEGRRVRIKGYHPQDAFIINPPLED